MSEPEDFLTRWSRRKREGVGDEVGGVVSPASAASAAGESGLVVSTVDLASLPSLESITAVTDIRAFLAPGVPRDLAAAALRRAWAADPAVRDFVGLADYAWDYRIPGSMAGFGPLEMTDDLRQIVARILGGHDEQSGMTEVRGTQSRAIPGDAASVPSGLVPDRSEQASNFEAAAVNDNATSRIGSGADCSSCTTIDSNLREHRVEKCPDNKRMRPAARRNHGRALPK